VAGFSSVHAVLGNFHPVWLAALVGALGLSFAGYYYAYEGMFTVAGGPTLKGSHMRTVVTVGFGGFLAHGAGVIDQYALEAAGADQREAKTRVSGLASLEHGILALGGTGTAIAVLAAGSDQPPLDFTIPWAVIPVPGFLIASWLAERYRDRFRGREGWRGSAGNFLESIRLIRVMFANPRHYGLPLAGMTLFWGPLVQRRAARGGGRRHLRLPRAGALAADPGVARPAVATAQDGRGAGTRVSGKGGAAPGARPAPQRLMGRTGSREARGRRERGGLGRRVVLVDPPPVGQLTA
jgi:hypothetical protein